MMSAATVSVFRWAIATICHRSGSVGQPVFELICGGIAWTGRTISISLMSELDIPDVTVLQPTIEAGYLYPLNNNFFITPTIAYGFEINIDTDGEDTGEGPILLLGLHVGRRF